MSKPKEAYNPHPYQAKAISFLEDNPHAGLFLEPGLGKTAITLKAFSNLKKCGIVQKALIVAPLSVCHNVWGAEIEKWADFEGMTYTVLWGKDKDKNLKKDVDIYLVNFEGLNWLVSPTKIVSRTGKISYKVNQIAWEKHGFDILVVDELSKFKDVSKKRFKMFKPLLPTFRYRWGLTGSPSANGLLGLYGQMYTIDMGQSLGVFLTHYRKKYFNVDYMGYKYTPKQGAEKHIYNDIAERVLSMKADDYLSLPKVIKNNTIVSLPKSVQKIYKEVFKDFFAIIEGGELDVANAASSRIKCMQIANGGVYGEEDFKRKKINLHNEKCEALRILIEELNGSPLLVAYAFQQDLERILEYLGGDIPYISGGVHPDRVTEIIASWNKGQIPVLLAQPKSMSHGLNLQGSGSRNICWFGLTYDYEVYDQFNRRILRQGNEETALHIHHIIARRTLDEAIIEMLENKRSGQDELFQAIKRLNIINGA